MDMVGQTPEYIVTLAVEGHRVVLDERSELVLRLNGTGTAIWNALTEEATWDAVRRRLRSELSLDASDEWGLVERFIVSLRERQFLNLVPE